jgi:hypothetical protein
VILADTVDRVAAEDEARARRSAAERVVVVLLAREPAARLREEVDGVLTWTIPTTVPGSPVRADAGRDSRRRRAARERRAAHDEPWGRRIDKARRVLDRRSGGRSESVLAPLVRALDALAVTAGRADEGWTVDCELSLGPVIDAERPDRIVVISSDLRGVADGVVRRARRHGRTVVVESGGLRSTPATRSVAPRRTVDGPAEGGRRALLGIGPTNSAGQATAWARAVREHLGVSTEVIAIDTAAYRYPSDIRVSRQVFDSDPSWGLETAEHALRTWSHALIESGRSPFGVASGSTAAEVVDLLRAGGVRPALVFHGSDIRDPERHALEFADSPFPGLDRRYVTALRDTARRNRRLAYSVDCPVFVSTPDQLDDLPEATWLPVVVDLDRWPLTPREDTGRVPLVVHAPSNPRLKGTAVIEAVVAPMVAAGSIRYQAVTGVTPDEAAALVRRADIVVDQLTLGLYGVLACEALASGAVVIGQVGERIRERVPAPVPILEASPATLEQVLRDAVHAVEELRAQAGARRAFVERFHDGCYSAGTLRGLLSDDSSDVGTSDERSPPADRAPGKTDERGPS